MGEMPIIWQVVGGALAANGLTALWVWGLWKVTRFERDNPHLVGQDSRYPLGALLALIPAPAALALLFWIG